MKKDSEEKTDSGTAVWVVVAVDVDSTAVCLPTGLFRPIKTPEQIAAEDRQLAIDEMCNVIRESDLKTVAALYDAGYRKVEVEK